MDRPMSIFHRCAHKLGRFKQKIKNYDYFTRLTSILLFESNDWWLEKLKELILRVGRIK